MSTKVKDKESKAAPWTAPADWWKKDISNPEVFRREFADVEKMLKSLDEINSRELRRKQDAEEASLQLEALAQEIQDREDERKRLWGDKYPPVFGQKPRQVKSQTVESTTGRRRGRPPGSKNKPK